VVQGLMTEPGHDDRDRDRAGRPRSARSRDALGRPLPVRSTGPPVEDPPALPPAQALASAQQLLDDGRPFTAHEVLEAVWKQAGEPDRVVWRGLAQIAVGMTHALRGNEPGARSLLDRGAASLAAFAGTTPYGIDIDGVRAWATRARADLSLVSQPPHLAITKPR
jgi:uncharacterized protein